MYQVSQAFLNKIKEPIQEHRLTGTIGNQSFSEDNIVEGSFTINNQSTDTSDVVLGSCYVGQLTAEFTGIDIAYGNWINKTITPTFSLNLGDNTWESVPLGIYKIKEAKHTDHGVQVTAYDNMIKFDKKFRKSHYMNLAGTWNIISQICTDAGVTLGMTQAQIEALPNGDRTGINIYGSTGKKSEFANDITTLRDLLFWVAQTMGCFATINRAGQLEFRKYTQTVADEINEQHRLTGATFADYVTHYIGIYVDNLDTNTFDYYGYDAEALQQELSECEAEANQILDDMEEVQRKYDAHEITEEEYNAQMKALQKEHKKLLKRMSWLEKALQQADDGASMDLGANPLLCDSNLTTRDAERRAVLKSLDAISYTPFSTSCIHGVIYDLGDVIQFSGGLYNSENDSFGCVMSWTYTHNGGTELEGFGVDPAVQLVRTKTQKSADRANTNAINAKEISDGETIPEDGEGKEDDVYFKTRRVMINTHPLDMSSVSYYMYDNGLERALPTDPQRLIKKQYVFEMKKGEWEDTGYHFIFEGAKSKSVWYSIGAGACCIKLPLTQSGTYTFHGKFKYQTSYPARDESSNGWVGFEVLRDPSDFYTGPNPGHWAVPTWYGGKLNIDYPMDEWQEWTGDFGVPSRISEWGYMWLYFTMEGCMPHNYNVMESCRLEVKDFYITSVDEDPQYKDEVDKIFIKINNKWRKIKWVEDADKSQWSGLTIDDKKVVHLKSEVMRAWYKADPPQIERDFSQFCVRYTGKPDTGITISYHGASGWAGQDLKLSDEGIYSIKCGGTRRSGEVDYVAYKIEGLVSGARYYFNFAANIGNSATFGDDFTKGLGLIFNTSGSIDSNDWSGDPHTFDDSTLYESFYRSTGKRYYNFGFEATASTMYMIVTVADIDAGITTVLNLTEFVISQEERKYIREFYLYDFHVNEWLKYKPFGTKDDGSAEGVTHLSELDDVLLDDLQNGQILEYDETSGKWRNSDNSGGVGRYADLPDKPSINSIILVGNKTSSDLGVVITLTQAQYDALPLAEKTDPNKVYYISDAGGGGGGTGADVLSDLDDVQISSLSDGQILKYDSSLQKWVNGTEYSYTLPVASGDTLGGIKVGNRLSIDSNGVLSADAQSYTLPIASANTLGGIKVGQNLSIGSDGTLNATGGGGGYVLPPATDNTLGGIKIGKNLLMNADNELWIDWAYTEIIWGTWTAISSSLYITKDEMRARVSCSGAKEDTNYTYDNCLFIINDCYMGSCYDENDNVITDAQSYWIVACPHIVGNGQSTWQVEVNLYNNGYVMNDKIKSIDFAISFIAIGRSVYKQS